MKRIKIIFFVACLTILKFAFAQQEDSEDDGEDGEEGGKDLKKKKKSNAGTTMEGKKNPAAAAVELDDEMENLPAAEPFIASGDVGYVVMLLFLLASCAALIIYTRDKRKKSQSAGNNSASPATSMEFRELQKHFLIGYGLNVAADWMQGPYVYKLYSFYGFSKGEIGFLFVAGFFSSMAFGTVVSSLADLVGRKRICQVYCAVYAMSCLTKHSTNFNVLICGRVLAGIATSILHSGFESWYIAQHKNENFPEHLMIVTLSWMSFIKGLVAIFAAVVSSVIARNFGFVAPFDGAIVFLGGGLFYIRAHWKENYGDKNGRAGSNFSQAWNVLITNPKVWLLGFIQSCFEGSMYIFVFSWTPILEATTPNDLPHGIVFGCFMVCIMIGSHFVSFIPTSEWATVLACAVASFSLFLPALTTSHTLLLISFCVFECCVGLYFPSIGAQRAQHIPNEARTTIMSIFRIPLNLIVVLTLLNVSQLSTVKISLYSSGLLVGATLGERFLMFLTSSTESRDGEETKSLIHP